MPSWVPGVAALLHLIPSICPDACPTVAMEAMTMGQPLIASRIGGLTDIVIDGETGCLVPPGNPQALREAVQCLLDNPVRRERMGNMAKQRVVEFQAKSVVSRIEQVYQELLRGIYRRAIPGKSWKQVK